MRVAKILLKSTFTLLILGVASALIAREVFLFLGTRNITKSLANLKSAYNKKTYVAKCRESGGGFAQSDISTIAQLRFLSSTEYVTEILCSQLSIDPIVIDHQHLPILVEKVPGSAGIIWGSSKSSVVLEIFGQQRAVGVENELIVKFSPDESLGVSPISTCVGYGFICCQPESQQGIGEKFPQALDCPKSCFATCNSRPIILAFNSQPAMDLKNRTLVINSNDIVSLSYVIDKGEAEDMSVTLDYGDGTIDYSTSGNTVVEHTYLCANENCRYNVKVAAKDSNGLLSAELPISTLTVIVRGGGL
ncbi:PKD domain-containing protein [Patescibacteria group bacterium]|nr:PKD domain-containing protein [Patescibacteria group bacterium]MBU1885191.1 PKD domain-containing protein [Patescibacteria group bacterium]